MISAGIEAALNRLPEGLLRRSGSVFYTGRHAFTGQRPLYLLGLNPGGDPSRQADETIGRHIVAFLTRVEPWSAYVDESWEGATPGTWGMQPRIRHLLDRLSLDPRAVPASNLIFARSNVEAALAAEKAQLIRDCWPVHQAVIDGLGIRAVLCLGKTVGKEVRKKLSAVERVDVFEEMNGRGWRSEAYRAPGGRLAITLTHPSRADWRNPASDPSPLIQRTLDRFG